MIKFLVSSGYVFIFSYQWRNEVVRFVCLPWFSSHIYLASSMLNSETNLSEKKLKGRRINILKSWHNTQKPAVHGFSKKLWRFGHVSMCVFWCGWFLSPGGLISGWMNTEHSLIGQAPWSVSFSFVLHLWADGCAGLPNIPHATWRRYSYSLPTEEVYGVDTVMSYYCLSGYRPKTSGSLTVTCQEDFKWSSYIECVGEFLLKHFLGGFPLRLSA